MNYGITFFLSFLLSFILTPFFRIVAIKFSILDHPSSDIKTHKVPTPYFGGLSIALSFFLTLIIVRLTTNFPTGTLRSLRGIIFGGIIIVILGLIDDIKYKGIHFTTKFLGEIIAALLLFFYDIKINFVYPIWFADLLTIFWIVGITNAINLIDVIDGLSSGIVIIVAFGFFLLSNFIEGEIYIGYACVSIMGACLGFLPYNLSDRYKIFMGDTGSLFLGFVLSAIALGGKYSTYNSLGVLAPLVVLLVPIYETFFISFMRLKKGQSPFLGSKDHFSLRLLSIGLNKYKVLFFSYLSGIILVIFSFLIVISKNIYLPLIIIFTIIISLILISKFLSKIKV
ncbi:MAG: undecaprenyl/decaprenyl-phosphate alpha-N-acetylglucosaminyl 1-phosphate transferase [Thermodesulfovibrio sp.]|nr:undecaprenyl/decaprenyl-phosphate alpha-N-acetylglucosaminyl 1-phosphate transferase [Thermodesulfovibrio sp.]